MTEIRGYTLAQVKAFMGAIERAEKRHLAGTAIAMRMAQADGSPWKTYMKGLTDV